MKEKLLCSGNKDKIDNLNIVFQDSTKELLQCRRKSLQYLADCYGYDFQKPFKVTGILGKFTANSIKKITGDDNGILLVCKGFNVNCVELHNGKFEVDVERGYVYSIDSYYAKYNFEADRKSGELAFYNIYLNRIELRFTIVLFDLSYLSHVCIPLPIRDMNECFTLDAIEHDKTVRKLFERMVDNLLEECKKEDEERKCDVISNHG